MKSCRIKDYCYINSYVTVRRRERSQWVPPQQIENPVNKTLQEFIIFCCRCCYRLNALNLIFNLSLIGPPWFSSLCSSPYYFIEKFFSKAVPKEINDSVLPTPSILCTFSYRMVRSSSLLSATILTNKVYFPDTQ